MHAHLHTLHIITAHYFIVAGSTAMNNSTIEVIPSVCLESITCVSSTNGTCVVYIGRNKSDALSRMSFTGAINSSISTAKVSNRQDILYVAQFDLGQGIIEIERFFVDIEGKD